MACVDGASRPLFFRSDGARLTWREEALVLSGLLSAMAHSATIECQRPLDPAFLTNIGRAQKILGDWIPTLRRCDIQDTGPRDNGTGRLPAEQLSPRRRVISFFSGGVDSFHTLLQNSETISTLVFVAGFSPTLQQAERCELAIASLRKVAAAFGKEFIVVTTNLRNVIEATIPPSTQLSPWEMAHGTALATVAHLVAEEGSSVLIPASFCHQEAIMPWGSHPLLDPLWSSSRVRVVSDGYWANRVDKCACVAQNQMALDNLIVCYQRRSVQPLNCGCCDKCILTMIGLLACGALERTPVFGHPLEADRVANMPIGREDVFLHACNLRALEHQGIRPDIQKALRHAMSNAQPGPPPWRRVLRRAFGRQAGTEGVHTSRTPGAT